MEINESSHITTSNDDKQNHLVVEKSPKKKENVVPSSHNSSTSSSVAEETLSQVNPSISDPTTDLTEEDIFRMKSMSIDRDKWKNGPAASEYQSAISLVDSASNYIEEDREVDEEEVDVTEGLLPDQMVPVQRSMSYADAVKRATHHEQSGKVFLFDGYAFSKNTDPAILTHLNPKTVSTLQYPFEPVNIPPGTDQEEYRRAFSQAQVFVFFVFFLVKESCEDVCKTVQLTQPDFVMVELCSSRIQILSMDEDTLLKEAAALTKKKMLEIVRQHGAAQGLMQVLLLSLSAHITQQLEMAPGGEFRAAYNASKLVSGCQLVLGDRPLHITQEDVERCKNNDILEELLQEMAGEYPQVSRILVDERDQYMTQVLHHLLQRGTVEKLNASKKCRAKFEPLTIVAVVGMGHVKGIHANWPKPIDSAALLTIPPPSLSSRVVNTSVRFAFYGSILAIAFFAGRKIFKVIEPRLPQINLKIFV
uniref:TraB domain-containing protein n=1 Tax=Meloidogyne floridensis TaxID=298350 RepID=A0A915NAN8_9BILA